MVIAQDPNLLDGCKMGWFSFFLCSFTAFSLLTLKIELPSYVTGKNGFIQGWQTVATWG